MKASHIGITIVIVLLILGSWSITLTTKEEDVDALFAAKVEEAKDYSERGLYEKAVITYGEALSIKDDMGTKMQQLVNARARFEEDKQYYNEYLKLARNIATSNPRFTNASMHVAKLYFDRANYGEAHGFLDSMRKKNRNSEVIKSMLFKSKHAYKFDWHHYEDVQYSNGDYYAVKGREGYSYVNALGNEKAGPKLEYAQAPGTNMFRYLVRDGVHMLVNGDDVIEAYLDFVPEEVGFYSEHFIPMKYEGYYAFYNPLGEKVLGDYEMAGSFVNGKAPVKQNDEWFLIDAEGQRVSENTYEDIVTSIDGKYIQNAHFLAKTNGSYKIFKDDEELVPDFEADDVDVLIGKEAFAFKKGDLWGYANISGEIIIEPQYIEAKSFSRERAAISNGKFWGFIDIENELIYEPQFYDVTYFNNKNNCMVAINPGEWKLLTTYVK